MSFRKGASIAYMALGMGNAVLNRTVLNAVVK